MTEPDKGTEILILEAAKRVFLRKGFDGARMQEIADEAGINKALLHYYFRSKNKLFDAIFEDAFLQFSPRIAMIISTDKPLFEKIRVFVDSYIDMLVNNPYVPLFVLHEINRSPDRILKLLQGAGIRPEQLIKSIQSEFRKGTIIQVKPAHLIASMIGMCIFPFVGRPILQGLLFNNNSDAYDKFLKERKKEIVQFIIQAITKNPIL